MINDSAVNSVFDTIDNEERILRGLKRQVKLQNEFNGKLRREIKEAKKSIVRKKVILKEKTLATQVAVSHSQALEIAIKSEKVIKGQLTEKLVKTQERVVKRQEDLQRSIDTFKPMQAEILVTMAKLKEEFVDTKFQQQLNDVLLGLAFDGLVIPDSSAQSTGLSMTALDGSQTESVNERKLQDVDEELKNMDIDEKLHSKIKETEEEH